MPTMLARSRTLLVIAGATMFAIATSAVAQSATQQSSAERPSFDVASIRAHDPMDQDTNNYQPYSGGKFTATNCSPWMLIHYAFQLQPYQIAGGPNSIRTEHYDVVAKPAEIHPGTDDIPTMVQRLLEDRFQLKYHWETRDIAGYDLVVIKAGKLPKSIATADCLPDGSGPGVPSGAACGYVANNPGHINSYNVTTDHLAGGLAWLVKAPINDKTNLTDKYDVNLQWTPDSVQARSDSDQDTPSIFTAVQDQLGLKLQPAKVPVRMLIIDHIAKPSEN